MRMRARGGMPAALLTAFLATSLTGPAGARAAPAAPPPWKGEAELGLVVTGGNTETRNLTAKTTVTREGARWRHTGHGEALNTSDGTSTTAERYLLSGKSDLKLGKFNYLFVNVVWEKDRFSGFNDRTSETLGYGRRLVHSPSVTLDAEVGGGARQSRETATGDHLDEGLARLAAKLAWKVSKTTDFGEEASVDIGEESTITRSVTSLKTQVAGRLATKITFTVRNTTDTPAGVKGTDYETAVALVYGFGE
jgi:putative salt-induced outer membrane protein